MHCVIAHAGSRDSMRVQYYVSVQQHPTGTVSVVFWEQVLRSSMHEMAPESTALVCRRDIMVLLVVQVTIASLWRVEEAQSSSRGLWGLFSAGYCVGMEVARCMQQMPLSNGCASAPSFRRWRRALQHEACVD